jgi:hypothetical protein
LTKKLKTPSPSIKMSAAADSSVSPLKAAPLATAALQQLLKDLAGTPECTKSADGRKTQVHVKFPVHAPAVEGDARAISLVDEFKGQVDFENGSIAGFRVAAVNPYKSAARTAGEEGAEVAGGDAGAGASPRKRARRDQAPPLPYLSGPREDDQVDDAHLKHVLQRALAIATELGREDDSAALKALLGKLI